MKTALCLFVVALIATPPFFIRETVGFVGTKKGPARYLPGQATGIKKALSNKIKANSIPYLN
jgi:hypothetical protein